MSLFALIVKIVSALDSFDPLGNSFSILGTNTSYNFVIIGSRTRGLTIAARLAKENNASVAIIEAGGFY